MRSTNRIALALVLTAQALYAQPSAVVGQPPAGAAATQSPADTVMAADSALAAALNAGDRETFAALVAANAVFLSAQGTLRGRDAIVAGWEPLMEEDRAATLTWQPAGARVAASGELAYTIGDYALGIAGSEEQEPSEERGRYLSVWRRQENGAWEVVADGPLRRDRAAYLEVELERRSLIGPGGGALFSFRPEGSVRAGSGDLMYTVGTYDATRLTADGAEEPVASGAWFSVWATDPETGDQRLLPAGDSVTPPPREPPAPRPEPEPGTGRD